MREGIHLFLLTIIFLMSVLVPGIQQILVE